MRWAGALEGQISAGEEKVVAAVSKPWIESIR